MWKLVGAHDNDKEIDEQGASDENYDSETGSSEYSSGESDSEDDIVNEDVWELLRASTRQN